jgi:hypothetical protein
MFQNQKGLINKISKHPQRKVIFCDQKYGDFGNKPRRIAYDYCTGDLIGYNDDDDYFSADAFSEITEALNKLGEIPDAIVYPTLRHESTFFNLPPAIYMTATGQYMHKPVIKGKQMKWLEAEGYLADGQFIEWIKTLTKFTPICKTKHLYVVPSSSYGK